MYCKYCKSQEHYIDNCPDIICRLCKQFGHPHWKCKTKQQGISQHSNKIQNCENQDLTNNVLKVDNHQKLEDFYQYMDKSWSEIC